MRQAQIEGGPPPRARAPSDPRHFLDSNSRTPFVVARAQGHYDLLALLNPFTPLAAVLETMNRTIGVPKLKALAAKVSDHLRTLLSLVFVSINFEYLRNPGGTGNHVEGSRQVGV